MAQQAVTETKIAFTLETLTPEDAARILQEHDQAVAAGEIINRGRRPHVIRRYAADQIAGHWFHGTGETLKFEGFDQHLNGRNLIDGQNRLAACIEAGRPLEVYVARGVAREAFAYIDGGDKRSMKDVLRISGEEDANYLAPTLAWLSRWNPDTRRMQYDNGATVATMQTQRRLLESDPAIRKSVTKAKAVKDQKLLGVGLAGALHRIFSRRDSLLADSFIDALALGANLTDGDPFLALRNVLIANKNTQRKLPQMVLVGFAIKAWNAKREGRELKLLRMSRGEETPVLEPAKREVTTRRGAQETEQKAARP